jgi:hypothetical protein
MGFFGRSSVTFETFGISCGNFVVEDSLAIPKLLAIR